MKNNIDKQMFEKQMHKPKEKADVVFNKLLAKQRKSANPFDVVRTQTWNPSGETKPGPDYA
jgi:hypothetical protein